jgi:hypothetical protein
VNPLDLAIHLEERLSILPNGIPSGFNLLVDPLIGFDIELNPTPRTFHLRCVEGILRDKRWPTEDHSIKWPTEARSIEWVHDPPEGHYMTRIQKTGVRKRTVVLRNGKRGQSKRSLGGNLPFPAKETSDASKDPRNSKDEPRRVDKKAEKGKKAGPKGTKCELF